MPGKEFEGLVKARIAARGWTTRACNRLGSVLEQYDFDQLHVELQDAMDEFDKRLANLDEAQVAVEKELASEDLEADIEEAGVFRDKVRKKRVQATKRLADILKSHGGSEVDSVKSTHGGHLATVKLPRLELPKFCGVLTDWQPFWDKFQALVHESELPVISKFSYLQSLLEGEAKLVVEGLAITEQNYEVACDMLVQRYGRKERIIFAHIQGLLNISTPPQGKGPRVPVLWRLQDELLKHIRSLEALGVKGDEYGIFLTPVILSRLPNDIRMEWARDGEGKESDLDWLLTFLRKEIERRERSEIFKEMTTTSKVVQAPEEKRIGRVATASALQAPEVASCAFCGKSHKSEKCWEFLKLDIPERQKQIQTSGLCFRCLCKGHIAKGCFAKCAKCKGRHHLVCCRGDVKPQETFKTVAENNDCVPTQYSSAERETVSHVGVTCNEISQKCTVLQTAKVMVYGERGYTQATVLFDSGSDKSYISESLVKKIKPKCVSSEILSYAAFGGGKSPKGQYSPVYDLHMDSCDGKKSLLAVEVPVICTPLFRSRVPYKVLEQFGSIKFADSYQESRKVSVDILIGLDAYWRFIKPESVYRVRELVAQESVFGWVLSGSCESEFPRPLIAVSPQLFCMDVCEAELRNFWNLESIGILPKEDVNCPDPVWERFTETIHYIDGRYEVSLPWKSEKHKNRLLNNEGLARKRLESMSRRIGRDPVLKDRYNAALAEFEVTGIVTEVPPEEISVPYPTFYLPHRPVVREDSLTTKIRPVFDASAHGYNGVSLNDCLQTGPSLNPILAEVLIRFRRWKVALTADITKAFLQIRVCREDQDAHRFLWDCNGRIRVMRFLRVPFGNKSSPFLLNATIKYHLATCPSSRVVEELYDNLYVDDWLTGANSVKEASDMFDEARQIMDRASMHLAKCSSNSRVMIDKFTQELGGDPVYTETMKVLGLKWLASADCFTYDGIQLPLNLGVVCSKRAMLSLMSRLYDPLGFLTPFTIRTKILFQEVWRLGIGWDEELPNEICTQFLSWLKDIDEIRDWQIPRCYVSSQSWQEFPGIELHGFGDASEKGYGAVVYIRAPCGHDEYEVSLVIAKAKVAPLKRVTLPRLELLGSLLCARMIVFARQALRLSDQVHYRCWTDSAVTLNWIQGDPSRWKMFVANRVSEIQDLTSVSVWSHCPGKDNPADLCTRGVSAQELVSSRLWLKGPPWLSKPLADSFGDIDSCTNVDSLFDEKVETVTCVVPGSVSQSLFPVDRWSSFTKALRVTAWMLRFLHNVKCVTSDRKTGDISQEELVLSQMKLLIRVQLEAYPAEIEALRQGKLLPRNSSLLKLDPFLGEDGFLRIRGRLQQSDLSFDSKHPVIVPKGHLSKLLVQFQHVLLKHAGVNVLISTLRNGFWIIGVRRLAKQVVKDCFSCKRLSVRACSQPVAPLPDLRIKRAPPFTVTGLDYAGPLFCVDLPGKKLYILLFTCAVIRAIHLELTDSMSLIDFKLALRRFAARRGLPEVLYSDNAKTFVAASQWLIQHYGASAPRWKFIVPRSPWWGGWWERLVRSVKSALKKTLGLRCLTHTELETTLHEIESCINSRPLTFVGDEMDSSKPLSPSHFLMGGNSGYRLETSGELNLSHPFVVSTKDLSTREAIRCDQLEEFWSRWSSDYLRNLPPAVKGFLPNCHLKVGSVVLVREDNIPRLSWPIGVVTEVFPGKDGVVRSVSLRTSKGVFKRPVQKLHDLELFESPVTHDLPLPSPKSDTRSLQVNDKEEPIRRSSRTVKPVNRLNL